MAKIAALKTKTETEMIPYEGDIAQPARLRVIVDHRSSLLTHNPATMGLGADAKKGSRIPEPDVEAEAGVYRTSDGICSIKGESFRGAILAAAGAWKIKRSTARSRVAHLVIVEELVALHRRDGTPISDYAIDARRARVQRAGIIRHRPRFDEWSATFTIEYDPIIVVDPKLIIDILQDAGGRIGVGDYRPACNGWFGRFSVRSWGIVE